jgi:hypothetical protein
MNRIFVTKRSSIMFRHLTTAVFALALAGTAAASGLGTQPPSKGVGILAGYAAQAVQDHLQSQLDWRSYYLDRVAGDRGTRAPGEDVRVRHPLVYGE